MQVYDDLFSLPATAWDVLVSPFETAPEAEGACIGKMGFELFASPAYLARHPFTEGANSLADHRVIGASGGLTAVASSRWFGSLGGTVALAASSAVSQLKAAARGQGIAVLPAALAAIDDRLVRIGFPVPDPAEVWMLAPPRSAGNARSTTSSVGPSGR